MEQEPGLTINFPPVAPGLRKIYENLPDETLAAEQDRLIMRFTEIGSKLVAISEIRETK